LCCESLIEAWNKESERSGKKSSESLTPRYNNYCIIKLRVSVEYFYLNDKINLEKRQIVVKYDAINRV